MGPSRRRLLSRLALVWLGAGLLGGAVACGSSPAGVSPAATTPITTDRLVLWARPQFITGAGLDDGGLRFAGLRLDARAYSSGEDVLTDLATGHRADVVEVCTNESAERLARQGLLRPLDTSRIEQWDRLYPVLKDLPGVVVDGQVYMVPVTAAVTGLLYDPATVTRPPDGFSDLFDRRFKGRLAFADDAALAFQIAALDLGLPNPVRLSPEQAQDAEIYLKRFGKNYRSFWYDLDNLASAFEGGRVAVAIGDRRDALELARRGASVSYSFAAEGQPLSACGLAITTDSQHPDAAYGMINRSLEPAVQAELAVSTNDLVANRDATDLVSYAEGARLGLTDLARLDRPVARIPSLEHLDWIQDWYEVKKGRG